MATRHVGRVNCNVPSSLAFSLFIFTQILYTGDAATIGGIFPPVMELSGFKKISSTSTCGLNNIPLNYCLSSTENSSVAVCSQRTCLMACCSICGQAQPSSVALDNGIQYQIMRITDTRPGSTLGQSKSFQSGSRIEFANIPVANTESRGISCTAWVKQLLGNVGTLVSKGQSYSLIITQYEMYFMYTTKDAPVVTRNATIRNVNSYVSGRWQHVAFVVYGKDLSIFVDGQLQRALVLEGFLNDVAGTITVGQSSGNHQFNGLMQEMKYYSKGLTNREVVESMTGTLPAVFAYGHCRCPSSHPAISPTNSFFCMKNRLQTSTELKLVLRLDPNAHPIEYTVDGEVVTYWLSEMTNEVTVDVDLKYRDLQISMVQLQFYSPPASGIKIDRSVDGGITYQPWQYFATNCVTQYNLPNNGPLNSPNAVNCLQISSPSYSLESISFRTHEPGPQSMPQRPFGVTNCNDIYCSPELLEFVKATNVRIQLSGHTLATHPNHQYFGIRKIVVGGSCDCFGHGSECNFYEANSTHAASYACTCDPRTFTGGPKCDRCLPLYNHKPFLRGTVINAAPCIGCPCNNHADECIYNASFDPDPTDRNETSGGGVCVNCKHNTVGRFCQSCRDRFFLASNKLISDIDACQPCDCIGAGVQPNSFECQKDGSTPGIIAGQCTCKANTDGRRCDQCKTGYYQLTSSNPDGCIPCGCSMAGTINSLGTCDAITGRCSCKTKVSGIKCDTCQVNYYGLSAANPEGCSSCSCDLWGSKSTACEAFSGQCICKESTEGRRCGQCKQGYYDLSETGCRLCRCSATGTETAQLNNCNRDTGQCKCRLYTTGLLCDRCMSGYYNLDPNNPLGCSPCQCDSHGTVGNLGECDLVSGNCSCKALVTGRQCNVCAIGSYNLTMENPNGCTQCLCNPQGTVGGDSSSPAYLPCTNMGQCNCLSNVIGARCTSCADQYYWNPTGLGCLQCSCDPTGAIATTCNSTGYCQCRHGSGVGGQRCDQCLPGYYNFVNGACQTCSCFTAGINGASCDSVGVCTQCKINVEGDKCNRCKSGTINLQDGNPFGCSGIPSQQSPPIINVTSARSAVITWSQPDNPNGIIAYYELYRNDSRVYRGLVRMYNDVSLTPYTSYTFHLLTFTAAGSTKSVDSGRIYRTPPDLPEGLAPLIISNVLDRSVLASWQPPQRPNGIIISFTLRSTNNRDAITSTHYTGNDVSYLVTSLKPFTIYTFTLVVCNTVGCVSGSSVVAATRSAAPDSQPAPYASSLPGGRSIFVYWDEPSSPNGNILAYDLYMREAPFTSLGKTVVLKLDPRWRNYTVQSLLPYTEYEFRVTSYTAQVNGDTASNWTRIRTKEDVPSGSEFISPSATALSATMITLTWQAPGSSNGILLRFEIYRYEASSQFLVPVLSATVTGSLRSHTLDRLQPYSRYEFTVKACNLIGCTSHSFKTSTTTLASAPSNQSTPKVISLSNRRVNISWSQPSSLNGPLPLSYIVERRPTSFYYPPPQVETGRRFPGNGFMQMDASVIPDSASSLLSLQFKTPFANGLLFYASSAGQEDLLVIELRDGKPWFIFDTESGASAFTIGSNVRLDDGQWHKILATRDNLQGRLVVDDRYVGNGLGGGLAMVIGQIASVFVGGLPTDYYIIRQDVGNTILQRRPFVGCLRNIRWKDNPIDLNTSVIASTNVSDAHEACPSQPSAGLHFRGGGFAQIVQTGFKAGSLFSLEFKFRSQWNKGLIFAAFAEGPVPIFIAVYFNGNVIHVSYRSKTLSNSYQISSLGRLVCDGNWHSFGILNTFSHIILTLDASPNRFGNPIPADVNTSLVYVGGVPRDSVFESALAFHSIDTHSFGGCFKDLKFITNVNFEQQIAVSENVAFDGCPSDSSPYNVIGTCLPAVPLQIADVRTLSTMDSNLLTFTAYQYRVKSYQPGVSGFSVSPWRQVRTSEGAPSGLVDPVVTAVDKRRVNMTWSPPTVSAGLVIKYQLVAKPTTNIDPEVYVDVPSPLLRSYNITGLSPYTMYNMCYRVFTSTAMAQSNFITVTTLSDVPEQFDAPTIDARPTSLNVTWQPPGRPNGRIIFYQLELDNVNYYNGPGLNVFIENLQIYTRYSMRLAVCGSGGCAWVELFVFTGQLPPENVAAPVLQVRGSRSIAVSWKVPGKLNGAIVKYDVLTATRDVIGDYTVEYTAPPGTLSVVLTTLIPGTFYYFRIAAYTGGGGTFSNHSTAMTYESAPEQLPPPLAVPISPQSIDVTILEPLLPNGIVIRYSLTEDDRVVLNGTSKRYVGIGFLPFSPHTYSSEACTIKGCAISNTITVYTLDAPPVGSVSLVAVIIGPRSVSARWTTVAQPNGNITYSLLATGEFYKNKDAIPRVYDVETTTQALYAGPRSAFPLRSDDLLPSSSYSLQVNASNRAGFILSNIISLNTPSAPPEGVGAPEVISLNSTALLVRWSPTGRENGVVTSYNLFGRFPTRDGPPEVRQLTNSIEFSSVVTLLRPFTTYEFRLAANNSAGATFSDWASGTTQESIPDGVDPPKIVSIQSSSVVAEISSPASPNGVIVTYVMFVNGSEVNRTLSRNILIVNLQPFTLYVFHIEACTQVGCVRSPNSPVYRTLAGVPDLMFPPRLLANDSRIVYVNWDPPASSNGPILSYDIQRRQQGQVSFTTIGSVNPTLSGNVYIDTAVAPFTTYNYRIVANTQAGGTAGPSSAIITLQDGPNSVSQPVVTAISSSSLLIRWQKPVETNGPITHYFVKIPDRADRINVSSTVEYTLINLKSFFLYAVVVSACSIGGCTDSPPTWQRTLESAPDGQLPPEASTLSSSSLRVRWVSPLRPNGPILRYLLERRTMEDIISSNISQTTPWIHITTTSSNVYDDNGLGIFSLHQYRVTVETTQGNSTSNASKSYRTGPEAPLTGPFVTGSSTNHTTVVLNWVVPPIHLLRGDPQHFTIQYEIVNGPVYVFDKTIEGIQRSATVSGLVPSTNYLFEVTMFNGKGSAKSNKAAIRTQDGAPEGFIEPTLSTVSATEIRVSWQPPQIPNGAVQNYSIVANGVKLDTVDGNTRNHVQRNLKPYTFYRIQILVCTVFACVSTPWSETRTDPAAPSNFAAPTASALTSSSVSVTWDPPVNENGIMTGYYLYRRHEQPCNIAPTPLTKCTYIDCALQEQLCGTSCYDPRFMQCCNGILYNSDASKRCCDTNYVTLNAPDDVCCGGQFYPKQSSYSCCFGFYKRVFAGQICCNGTTGVVVGFGDACCGDVPYNTNGTKLCICSTLYDKTTPEVRQCCGGRVVPSGQQCCGGGSTAQAHDFDVSRMCCGSNYVNAANALCCQDAVGNHEVHNFTSAVQRDGFKCCGTNAIPSSSGCCNNAQFDTSTHICADRSTSAGKSDCGNGMSCPISNQLTAYCDECNFDTASRTCGSVDGYYNASHVTTNQSMCLTDFVFIAGNPGNAAFRSYVDTGLESHTLYEYRVVGENTIGNATSDRTSVRTLMSSPEGVQSPIPVVVSDSLIVVSWQPPIKPNGNIMAYRLYRVKWTTKEEILVFDGLDLSYADRNQLEPNTGYLYILSACTLFCTNQSAAGLVYTQQASPQDVLPPVIIALSAFSLRVNWSLPLKPNGLITRYNITMVRNGSFHPILDENDLGYALTAVVSSLTPHTFYRFRTEACTSVGCTLGPVSGGFTLEAPPEGVEAPRLTILAATRIEVEWAWPTSPNGVILKFRLLRNGVVVFEGNRTIIHDTSVLPITTYGYQVEAVNSGGSTISSTTTITTPESTPDGIQEPQVTALSFSQLFASWQPPLFPNGIITGYSLIYNEIKGDITELNTGFSTSLTISNLKPFTVYELRVKACTAKGCGTGNRTSQRTLETTPAGQAAPLAVGKASDIIELSWLPPVIPNGVITSYEVERRLGASGVPIIIFMGLGLEYIDTQLSAFTVYEYRVRSRNSVGTAQSTWVSARTLEGIPSGFTDLIVVGANATSVSVRWVPPTIPNGIISTYEIISRPFGNPTNETVVKCCLPSTARETVVSNLGAATRFEFRLAATTGGGRGLGNWVTVQTMEAPPQGMPVLMADKNPDGLNDGKSLRIYWEAPSRPNGVITGYSLSEGSFVVYQGVVREAIVRRLQPFTGYTFQLSACNSAGCTLGLAQVLTTSEVPPTGQSPPTAGTVTANSVTLNWTVPVSPNGNIIRYEVIRRVVTSSRRRRATTEQVVFTTTDVNNGTFSFTDTNLQPFTTYEYKIRVVNSAGELDSAWITVTTEQGPPTVVNPPTLTPLAGGTSMLLQWVAPAQSNGDIQYYLAFRNGSLLSSTSGLTYTDTGLQPNTMYAYTISACTLGGCGQSSASYARTLSAGPAEFQPPVLKALSSSQINASWSEPPSPDGIIIKYQLRFAGTLQLLFEGFAFQFTVTGLVPFTSYSFTISACTSSSCTTSQPSSITTLEEIPLTIDPPSLFTIGPREIQVTWLPPTQPNGRILYYTLHRDSQPVYNGSDTRYIDRTVQPGTRYGYSITATNSAGFVTSTLAFVTTTPGAPEGLQAPTLLALSSSQMQVIWTEPSEPNGIITSYFVQYIRRDDIVSNEISVGLSLSHVIPGLLAFTRYDVRIRACTTAGCSSSLPTTARTAEASPSNQTAPYYDTAFVFPRSVLVQWLPPIYPNGIITSYALFRRLSSADVPRQVFQGAALAFTDATDGVITPNTAYEYQVVSSNSAGSSSSAWSVVTTKQAAPDGVQPIEIIPQELLSTSFGFTIVEPLSPNGVILNYILVVTDVANLTLGRVARGTANNLMPYTNYTVRLSACNAIGCGLSASVIVTTNIAAPSGLDSPPRVLQVTSSSVFVEWDPPSRPNGPLTSYKLERYYTCPQESVPNLLCVNETIVQDNGLVTMLNSTGLRPFSKYTFRVRAHNEAGSQQSPSVSATTSPEVPLVVAVPKVTVSGNLVTVNWTETFNLRSPLKEFVLEENNVLAYTGNLYVVDRPNREVGEYSYVVRAFTTVNGEVIRVNAPLVKVTVGLVVPPTAAGRTADTVWYKEVWFLALIAFIGIAIIFVCIVLLLRCCNNTRTVYVRERDPLPTRVKSRLDSRGPSPMTWDALSEKGYPHIQQTPRGVRSGKLPLELLSVTPNHYSSARELLASTDRLPNSRLDDPYSYLDDDDPTWDGYIKSTGNRAPDRDSGLYDDDKLSPISNDDDDSAQGYHSIQQERILFPDTHL